MVWASTDISEMHSELVVTGFAQQKKCKQCIKYYSNKKFAVCAQPNCTKINAQIIHLETGIQFGNFQALNTP